MSVCSRGGLRSLVLVVFIGGVTSAEIAALRFLSAQVLISIFPDVYRKWTPRCYKFGTFWTMEVICDIMSLQEGMGYDFLVATTKVITGNRLLRPIIASSKEGTI
jgi:hypothetical protein